MTGPLLDVQDLTVTATVRGRAYTVLDRVSFQVQPGEKVGLVGESGSGKSMTLRAIDGLLPENAHIAGGDILFEGRSLVHDRAHLLQVRGAGIAMVFQEPAVALNPIQRVGWQIADTMRRHQNLGRRQAFGLAVDLMDQVGITDPAARAHAYPFELSGGMRQRVMIAAAIANRPRLILCDEPTTALDVTVQAQVMDLLATLSADYGTALLYVTHDMAVVATLCTAVAVLYSGQVVEEGPVRAVFDDPFHPYTFALLRSTPRVEGAIERLQAIAGTAPALDDRPAGCPFAPRCEAATAECARVTPELRRVGGRAFACHHPVRDPGEVEP
jgi:peptide/nickel transport system ATP-binding protein/oligopeptide transport system ATP-binding protein